MIKYICIFLLVFSGLMILGENTVYGEGEYLEYSGLKDNQKSVTIFLFICVFLLITMLLFFKLEDKPTSAVFGIISMILMLLLALILFSPYEYGFIEYEFQEHTQPQVILNNVIVNQEMSNYEGHYSFIVFLEYPDMLRVSIGWILVVLIIGIAFISIIKFIQ